MKHKLTDLEKKVNYYAGCICILQILFCLGLAIVSANSYVLNSLINFKKKNN